MGRAYILTATRGLGAQAEGTAAREAERIALLKSKVLRTAAKAVAEAQVARAAAQAAEVSHPATIACATPSAQLAALARPCTSLARSSAHRTAPPHAPPSSTPSHDPTHPNPSRYHLAGSEGPRGGCTGDGGGGSGGGGGERQCGTGGGADGCGQG